jgi:hypothetical protein
VNHLCDSLIKPLSYLPLSCLSDLALRELMSSTQTLRQVMAGFLRLVTSVE